MEVARIPAGSTLPSLLIQARTYTPPDIYAPFGVSGLVPFSHCDWLKFKYGRINLTVDLREGRPSTATIEDKINAVQLMIETDKRVTHRQSHTSLGIANYRSQYALRNTKKKGLKQRNNAQKKNKNHWVLRLKFLEISFSKKQVVHRRVAVRVSAAALGRGDAGASSLRKDLVGMTSPSVEETRAQLSRDQRTRPPRRPERARPSTSTTTTTHVARHRHYARHEQFPNGAVSRTELGSFEIIT
ncbi:hypothetical protein EVAR_85425_1 [Eumeta japonica]|uniref:Uncharacterized protein n=1 Tax=Eumeta variegata TaxID=151549 RepID=A0A4C1WM74_EUMVA|nr:hypothetical protein EVAR_85425_1 [Eumeta japonica]